MEIFVNGESLKITNLEDAYNQANQFRGYQSKEVGKSIYWNRVYVELLRLKIKEIEENEKLTIFEGLWDELGNVPVNNDDELEEDFLIFESGADKLEVWHWFEDFFNITLGEILN